MRSVHSIGTTPSLRSEVTVTSPAPKSVVGSFTPHSDAALDRTMHAQRIQHQLRNPRPVTPQTTPQPDQPKPPGFAKKFFAFAGVAAGIGIVGGLISIAALGPLGLAVAGGMALLSAVCIGISTKCK